MSHSYAISPNPDPEQLRGTGYSLSPIKIADSSFILPYPLPNFLPCQFWILLVQDTKTNVKTIIIGHNAYEEVTLLDQWSATPISSQL